MGSTPAETTVTATSGDDREREIAHTVTLDKDYYIGLFEVTQKQWKMLGPDSTPYFTTDGDMRPMENVCFNEMRVCAIGSTDEVVEYRWPARPNPDSFLGKLCTLSGGIDFDLPSEAQWEFACRAGNGDCFWNNGLPMVNVPFTQKDNNIDSNLNLLARYNQAKKPAANTSPAQGGTAIVGSYLPNSWGIYDMHGNVLEHCLDAWKKDISSDAGAVYLGTGGQHRGGCYWHDARRCRAARRDALFGTNNKGNNVGLRVVCTTGLN
jgi:formylglycine-generating enzyme required for sulfatase activity